MDDDLDLVKAVRVTEVLARVGGQRPLDAEVADRAGPGPLVNGGHPDSLPRRVILHQLRVRGHSTGQTPVTGRVTGQGV